MARALAALAHISRIQDLPRAERRVARAVDLLNEVPGLTDEQRAEVLYVQPNIRMRAGDYERAAADCQTLLAMPNLQPNTRATVLNRAGHVSRTQGRWTDALRLYREALAIDRDEFGERHPQVASDLMNVGGALALAGDPDGLVLLDDARTQREEFLGADHPRVSASWWFTAVALVALGRPEAADAALDRVQGSEAARRFAERPLPSEIALMLGDPERARRLLPPPTPGFRLGIARRRIVEGRIAAALGETALAREALTEGRDAVLQMAGPDAPEVATATEALADLDEPSPP